MQIPLELRYSADHEWARREGSLVRVGLTDFAQEALGDVVFVSLPKVGEEVEANGRIGEVESTKSVSELYAPVGGEVVEVNEQLLAEPGSLNSDPYGEGWLCVISPRDSKDFDALLNASSYRELTVT